MAERDPWDWREGQHWHQYTTNGDRYRCPAPGCWWTATGVQVVESAAQPAEAGHG